MEGVISFLFWDNFSVHFTDSVCPITSKHGFTLFLKLWHCTLFSARPITGVIISYTSYVNGIWHDACHYCRSGALHLAEPRYLSAVYHFHNTDNDLSSAAPTHKV